MKIAFKPEAAKAIKEKMEGGSYYVKLHYDTEGCGCGVNGLPVIWLVKEKESEDMVVETNEFPVVVEKSALIYFDEPLTIDVSGPGMFRLSSPNEILNARMPVVKK
ncbi:uncharacterized protein YqkB [Bacillus ectoiniformans]|uniref:iron-sulfur cluster biosynthesis family protein n=1 Tax=Bacillus ectoiniformans TaxID=1494429 RepID=UPI00195AD139|nr:iron-sulfur cluster biosynthesis family protein [Bacillus ectoiniformans]MBM7648062.1 uncharacterized protein YqkB [Bacillus ectoiniformans]